MNADTLGDEDEHPSHPFDPYARYPTPPAPPPPPEPPPQTYVDSRGRPFEPNWEW